MVQNPRPALSVRPVWRKPAVVVSLSNTITSYGDRYPEGSLRSGAIDPPGSAIQTDRDRIVGIVDV